MEEQYTQLAERRTGSGVRIAKFQADVERDFAQSSFGLQTFPTIVLLPKGSDSYIKYPSERRDADTLDLWLNTLAG